MHPTSDCSTHSWILPRLKRQCRKPPHKRGELEARFAAAMELEELYPCRLMELGEAQHRVVV